MLTAQSIRSSLEAGTKLFKEDPFEYGANAEWLKRKPMPLDFSSTTALQQSMAEHATAATAISSKQGVAPISALTPAEAAQVKNVMQTAPIDTRLAVLNAITSTNMPEPVMRATLAGLGKDEATAPLAWAGSLARYNPGAARDIVAGQAMMEHDPKLGLKKSELQNEVANAIPMTDLPPGAEPGILGRREALTIAIGALYAKRSADQNDSTGVFNQARFDRAVEDASGGIRSYRGSSIVAPWYGASQYDTDAAIRLLTAKDVAGAATTDGKPFPVEMLKPSFGGNLFGRGWRLQSAGDGKYFVFSGEDQSRQYLGRQSMPDVDQAAIAANVVPGQTSAGDAALGTYASRAPVMLPGKFVLDLGAKREAVRRDGLHLALPSSGWLGFPVSTPEDDAMR